MPHFEIDAWDRVASVDVDDLVVKNDVDALLLFDDIATDILSADVVWALGDLRGQDARVVPREDGRSICAERISKISSIVRSGQDTGSITLSESSCESSMIALAVCVLGSTYSWYEPCSPEQYVARHCACRHHEP